MNTPQRFVCHLQSEVFSKAFSWFGVPLWTVTECPSNSPDRGPGAVLRVKPELCVKNLSSLCTESLPGSA